MPDDPRYRCRHEEWTVNPAAFESVDQAGDVMLTPGAKKVCLICGCDDVDADLIARAHPAGQSPPPVEVQGPKADPVTLHRPVATPRPAAPLEPVSRKDLVLMAALGAAAVGVIVVIALSYRGVVTI